MDWLLWLAAVALILVVGWFMVRRRKPKEMPMETGVYAPGYGPPTTSLTDTPQDDRPSG